MTQLTHTHFSRGNKILTRLFGDEIQKFSIKFLEKVKRSSRNQFAKSPPIQCTHSSIVGTMPQIMVIYGSLLILSRNNTKDNRIRPTSSIINSCWIMSGRIEGGAGEREISSLEFSHPSIVGMLSPFRGDDKEEGAIRRHSGASFSMTLGVVGEFFLLFFSSCFSIATQLSWTNGN